MEASSDSTDDETWAVNRCKRQRIELSDDALRSPGSGGACFSGKTVCSVMSASLPNVSIKQSIDSKTIDSLGHSVTSPLHLTGSGDGDRDTKLNDRYSIQTLNFGDYGDAIINQDDEEPAIVDHLGSNVDNRGDSSKISVITGSKNGALSFEGQDVSCPSSSTIDTHLGRRKSHDLPVESSLVLPPRSIFLSTLQDVRNQESKSSRQKSHLGVVQTEESSGGKISALCSWSYVSKKEDNQTFDINLFAVADCLNGPHINKLPSSLLLYIFSYLSLFESLRKASLVCKYWYNLCRDPSLWHFLNLGSQMKVTDRVLEQISSFSDRVTDVDLTDCRFLTNTGIRALLNRCRYLKTLKAIRCFDLTDDAFIGLDIGKASPRIQRLHFDGCCRLTDMTVIQFAKGCPDIQLLHLNQCNKMTDRGIITLAQNCHKLKRLLLDHCEMVTDAAAMALTQNCPDLEYLNVMSCGFSDEGVLQLTKLKKLTVLDLSNIVKITPHSVVKVVQHCTQLECLNVSLNQVIDDACVTEIARYGSNLRRLYCVSCHITDEGLKNLAKYRPNLEALDIAWCQLVTITGVKALSEACPKLSYLGLIKCDNVHNESMEELVVQFPHIKYSTFILESRRLIDRARREGFQFTSS